LGLAKGGCGEAFDRYADAEFVLGDQNPSSWKPGFGINGWCVRVQKSEIVFVFFSNAWDVRCWKEKR
jgi:hypothetical protein